MKFIFTAQQASLDGNNMGFGKNMSYSFIIPQCLSWYFYLIRSLLKRINEISRCPFFIRYFIRYYKDKHSSKESMSNPPGLWPMATRYNLFYSLGAYIYKWSEHYSMYHKNQGK